MICMNNEAYDIWHVAGGRWQVVLHGHWSVLGYIGRIQN